MIRAILFDLGDTLIGTDGTGKPLPHAVETLRRLRKGGYKMGVICNATKATGKDVEEIMEGAGILEFFDTVVVSTDVGVEKPDVRIFKIALERLSVKPLESVMIGNRLDTDILGGNLAGTRTALLRCNKEHQIQLGKPNERPNLIIRSLTQVPAAVESLGLETFLKGSYLMLSFLRNVKTGRATSEDIDRIMEDESYQLMMHHYHLPKERMKIVLQSLAACDPPQEGVESLVYESLMRDMSRMEEIESFLNEIETRWNKIVFESTKAALEYLPEGTTIQAKIHFIFGGHSDAYTVGEENIVLNISMFLGNLTYIEMVLPHELHHMGLSSVVVSRPKPNTSKEEKLRLLVGGTKGEGLATYVMYQVMKTRKVELWSRTYRERMRQIDKHFHRIEGKLLEINQGKDSVSKEELYEDFFSRMGIAYFVGCKMAEIIEDDLGRKALIDCMPKPPEEFFLSYNTAAKKLGEYAFNEKTIGMLTLRR